MSIFAETNNAMLIKDQNIIKDIRSRTIKVEDLTDYLVNNFPAGQIARELAENIITNMLGYDKPVVVTMEQFERFFRVQGYRVIDGVLQKEPRGKYKKDEE